MPEASTATNSPIVARYRERTPTSRALHAEARELFPSGIVHDSRHMDPYPFYVERAEGPRKWDADGNVYIDYYGGHGALLLGHAHPSFVAAVHEQAALGTHPAACHRLEMAWAALVQRLIPTAERVRFTASGTEANLMAIRLARAFTGRRKLVRFQGHFHGWQDHVAFGSKFHPGTREVPGVLPGIVENVIVAPAGDADALADILAAEPDVAAVILEPTGASSGQTPLPKAFAAAVRELTGAAGALLLFDEVVTGFRVSPGGAQALWGVRPDLTALAKILAGGLPGGAVCGRRDVMELLDFEAASERGFEKVPHQGTFNANPLSAAAGAAMLRQVAETDVVARAAAAGDALRHALNEVFAVARVPWAAYGVGSSVYVFTNPDGVALDPHAFDPFALPVETMMRAGGHPAAGLFRVALLNEGVDFSSKPGAIVSAVHTEDDIAATAEAVGRALRMLQEEGAL